MIDNQCVLQGRRLKEIREKLHLSQGDVARMINVAQASYSNVEHGKNYLSMQKLNILVEKLKFSPTYVITGSGPMILGETHNFGRDTEQNASVTSEEINTKSNRYKHILAPIPVNAGISNSYSQDWINYDFIVLNLPDIRYYSVTFQVTGDSMEPDFEDGDYVVTTKVEDRNTIKSGSVMVIVTSSGLYLKILEFKDDGIYLVSMNKAYRPISIEKDEIKELYRPLQKISKYP